MLYRVSHSRKKRNDIVSVYYDKGTSIKTQLSNNIKTGKFNHIYLIFYQYGYY